MADFKIREVGLADSGFKKIEWASTRMPVLRQLVKEHKGTKPLQGVKISACLHVTSETANL